MAVERNALAAVVQLQPLPVRATAARGAGHNGARERESGQRLLSSYSAALASRPRACVSAASLLQDENALLPTPVEL
eukprot:COSAG06_NODE_2671_length_6467_cov_46.974560_1_plen_77_part_00